MEAEGVRRRPPKMSDFRNKRNKNLCCAFHRDIDHDTEKCKDIKKEIEELIKQRYLE